MNEIAFILVPLLLILIAAIIISCLNTGENYIALNLGETVDVDHNLLMGFLPAQKKRSFIDDTTVKYDPLSPGETYNVCIGEIGNEPSELYNLSVRKMEHGYSGIIRGSGNWKHNVVSAFSSSYYISLDDNASVVSMYPIDFGREFDKCTKSHNGVYANGVEDPRIFIFRGEEWVIGNVLGSEEQQYPCSNAMCIFKASDPKESFRILYPPNGVNLSQRQKNWSPFEYNDELYCEYSIEPHAIIHIDTETGYSKEKWSSGLTSGSITEDTSLRGGAPPILISSPLDSDFHLPNRFYLGIGHVRSGFFSNYLHFFYIFEDKPPFQILKISHKFKLSGEERIQFATGLSVNNDMVYVSYGVNDRYNRITRFHISDVLRILFPLCE